MNKETLFWSLVTLSALAALGYLLGQSDGEPLFNTADERHSIANDFIGGHGSGVAEHYHPILTISIMGENVPIPDNVGLNDGDCTMRPLHTHSGDGKIHAEFAEAGVEAPLEAFFDIWGKHMDATGFDEHRVDANHEFLMYLNTYTVENGQVVVDSSQRQQIEDFENLILEDMQYIELIYREIA